MSTDLQLRVASLLRPLPRFDFLQSPGLQVRVCFGAMVPVCACLNFPTTPYVEGPAIDSECACLNPPAMLSVPLSRPSLIRRALTLPLVDGLKVNGRFRLALFNRRPSGVHTGASRVGKIQSADLKPTNCAASQPRTRVRPGRRSRAFGLPRGARHRRIARRRAEDAPGCTMRVTSCVCAKTYMFVETVGNRLATVLETVVFLWKPLETVN